jgi:cytoskeletal protein CcmA (bactofilin family)
MLNKRSDVMEAVRPEIRADRPAKPEARPEARPAMPGATRSYGRPDLPNGPASVIRETGRMPAAFAHLGSAAREPEPAPQPEAESKRLIVGRHINLSGEIRTCDRLVVEGCVEASLYDTRAVEIAPGGVFRGSATIESAEIGGLFEGDLVVRERLYVKGTGRVVGNVQYGELEIERGGVVSGRLDTLAPDADRAHAAVASLPAEEPKRAGLNGNGAGTKEQAAGAG